MLAMLKTYDLAMQAPFGEAEAARWEAKGRAEAEAERTGLQHPAGLRINAPTEPATQDVAVQTDPAKCTCHSHCRDRSNKPAAANRLTLPRRRDLAVADATTEQRHGPFVLAESLSPSSASEPQVRCWAGATSCE